MIIYDFKCADNHRFEGVLDSMHDANPACACGAQTRRMPSRLNISGRASAGPSREDMPNTWYGTRQGNAELLRKWHSDMTKREKLEEKYPELAGDRRPVLAHEGSFESQPLRAGDAMVQAVADATFRPASRQGTPSEAPSILQPSSAEKVTS